MDKSLQHVQKFVSFATKHLKLRGQPHIRFVGSDEDEKQAFGHSKGKEVVVRVTNRHPIDVMRTLAHELTHFRQGNSKASDQSREDNANAIAGRIMRDYDTKYPKTFKAKPISEEGEGMTTSALPAIHTGKDIANFDPLLGTKKKKLRNILSRNAPV